MMMWQVNGQSVPSIWINIDPVQVLYDYDGPRIFTCKTSSGEPLLAYQCGDDKQTRTMRFLVVPCDDKLVWLITGDLNLRDALFSEPAWIVDIDYHWRVISAWKIEVKELPANIIPKPGVMLWSHLKPKMALQIFRSGSTITRQVIPTTTLPGYYVPQGGVAKCLDPYTQSVLSLGRTTALRTS